MSLWHRIRPDKPRSTSNCRIYAIGDVHGCFDLLVQLLTKIEQDQQERAPVETHIVFLGDYIDRGPESRRVCELLQSVETSAYFHCLRGNHEQTMLEVLDGSIVALRHWLRFGGGETCLSWGIAPDIIEWAHQQPEGEAELVRAVRAAVAQDIADWMRGLPAYHLHGDYLFVHAGIRPRVDLAKQSDDDLLWIREPFLSSAVRHPWRIVHGHSQSDQVDVFHHRIGIDTGAYRTGVLSAIGIEGDEHWTIDTGNLS